MPHYFTQYINGKSMDKLLFSNINLVSTTFIAYIHPQDAMKKNNNSIIMQYQL